MTRGKIMLIQGEMEVYVTCEFNGDMHPNRYGEDILKSFKNGLLQNYKDYERFVENFNTKNFGYDDTLDAFGIHGIGGTVGAILTGVFADKQVGGVSGLINGDAS